ncbi:MAG: S-adenosyl-l-methionine hydroxide adenosyltransferase family protein [bacterium]
MEKIITLVTDFGDVDSFVASMKGVILEINNNVHIIDVTHKIDPFDLKRAAFLVSHYYKCFPKGSIHLLVVDPGVGSNRRALVVETSRYLFVAPDNGILSYIYEHEEVETCIAVDMKKDGYFREQISNTFHGRDVFAPVAAKLSLGVSPEEMGFRISDMIRFPLPDVTIEENKIIGEIIYIDGFGNALTSINEAVFKKKVGNRFQIHFLDLTIDTVVRAYSEVQLGETGAIFSSEGYLEIFSNQGNLAKKKHIKVGEPIIIKI